MSPNHLERLSKLPRGRRADAPCPFSTHNADHADACHVSLGGLLLILLLTTGSRETRDFRKLHTPVKAQQRASPDELAVSAMSKRSWSDANEGMEFMTVGPLSPLLCPLRNMLTGHGKPQLITAKNGEQSFPQISRKIKACAACRKHKVCRLDGPLSRKVL